MESARSLATLTNKQIAASIVTAAAVLGLGTIAYNLRQRKEKKRLINKVIMMNSENQRRRGASGYNEDDLPPSTLTLYYDSCDELVEEAVVKRAKKLGINKFHSVTVHIGADDDDAQPTITNEQFGKEKKKNAKIFL